MFQARSEWRHIRLIFDHAEGLLIRFTYSFSWVLYSNYHNCCAKHARLHVCWWDARVCAMRWRFRYQTQLMQDGWLGMLRKRGEEEGGYWYEGRKKGKGGGEWAGIMAQPTANDSPGQSVRPPGAPWDIYQQRVSSWQMHAFISGITHHIKPENILWKRNI